MTALKFLEFVLVLNIVRSFAGGDTDITCYFGGNCILPCTFSYGSEVVIHWIQKTQPEFQAHSWYYNMDQLGHQDQRFRDRTSLFKDEISRGNASLLLTGVMVQDQGRYQCYTSTITGNKEAFINLIVFAPVQRVNIEEMQNGTIVCRSDGIFPEPTLSWSSSPQANLKSHDLKVQRTEQQLFNIRSLLTRSDNDTDLDYSCTVETGKHKKKATLMKAAAVSSSDTEITMPCLTSSPAPMDLIWRFNRSQIILRRSRAGDPYTPSVEWMQHVKGLSESGSLTLKNLSPNHVGTYTCEFSSAEETHKKHTFLHRIEKQTDSPGNVAGIVVGVIAVLLLVGVAGFMLYKKVFCKKDNSEGRTKEKNKTEESKTSQQETQEENSLITHTPENSQKTEEDKK